MDWGMNPEERIWRNGKVEFWTNISFWYEPPLTQTHLGGYTGYDKSKRMVKLEGLAKMEDWYASETTLLRDGGALVDR